MITKNGCEGLIFLLNDKCSSSKDSKHNYLILGINEDHHNVGLVQCMSITSMHNKEITTEVPIVLSNGMVSYIVPYNIHSYTMEELDLHDYKGCITDTSYITKYEFIQLILDLYTDAMDYGLTKHRDVMRRYKKYCDAFWKNNKGVIEFRDYKDTTANNQKDPTPVTVEPKKKMEEEASEIKAEPPKSAKKKNRKRKSNSSKRHSKRCKQEAIRKQEKIEQKEFENTVKSVTGIDESTINKTNQEPVKETVPGTPNVPYSDFLLHTNDIELSDLTPLKEITLGTTMDHISDENIVLFLKAYCKFPFREFEKVVGNRRWRNPGDYLSFHHLAKKEAIKRNITNAPLGRGNGLLPNDITNKPCSEWKDEDIKQYLDVTKNHKCDPKFLLIFTGCENENALNQLTYRVKKEAMERGFITVE